MFNPLFRQFFFRKQHEWRLGFWKSNFLNVLGLVAIVIALTGCLPEPATPDLSAQATLIPDISGVTKPTYKVQRGNVIVDINFQASVMPVVQQSLIFRIAGQVGKLYVRPGDTVKSGQVLAELNGLDALKRQKAQNDLDIQQVQTQANIAQLNLDLFKAQTAPGAPGYAQSLEIAQQQLTLAQIAVSKAQLKTGELDESIANSAITAPFDGQLRSLDIREGDQVEAFDRVGVVADVSQLSLGVDLTKETLQQLTENMPVSITPVGSSVQPLSGFIRKLPYPYGQSVATSAQSEQDSITWIALNGFLVDAGLKLDDIVAVNVVLQHRDNTLWLPPDAVGTFEGHTFVVIPDGDVQKRVDVNVGLRNNERLEILSGLTEGEVVLGQ